jgi:hypothetical protein
MLKDLKAGPRVAWAVLACALLALSGGTAVFAAPGPEIPSGGLHLPLTPLPVPPSKVVIDDFTSGPYSTTTTAPSGQWTQTGGMVGNARCIVLDASQNPYMRPNTVSVGGGHLFVETGVAVGHAVTLLYGVDGACASTAMDLNLTGADRFRLDFDQVDLSLAGALAVWSPTGIGSIPICMEGVAAAAAFTCDMPFNQFTGEVDWQHIQYIALVLESGGSIFSHDYGLKSITAVLDRAAAPGQHASTARAAVRLPTHTSPAAIRNSR